MTKRQKQNLNYATERWRDTKITLQNKLAKIKSKLQSQICDELCKPITEHKSFIEIRGAIESNCVALSSSSAWPNSHLDCHTGMTITRQQSIVLIHNRRRSIHRSPLP